MVKVFIIGFGEMENVLDRLMFLVFVVKLWVFMNILELKMELFILVIEIFR